MKRCPRCGRTKTLDEFYHFKTGLVRVSGYCRPCYGEVKKQYQESAGAREKRLARHPCRPRRPARTSREEREVSRLKMHLNRVLDHEHWGFAVRWWFLSAIALGVIYVVDRWVV